jgi:hypothetical protein
MTLHPQLTMELARQRERSAQERSTRRQITRRIRRQAR